MKKIEYEDKEKQAIFDFVKPPINGSLLIFVSIPLFFISLALLTFYFYISILCMALGVFFIILSIRKRDEKFDKVLEQYEKDSVFEEMKHDFKNGWHMTDQIVLGETYILGKRSGGIFKYSEITQIYQTVHKTNGVTNGRSFTAVVNGREEPVTLCALNPGNKKSAEMVKQLMAIIMSKNPNLSLGYK